MALGIRRHDPHNAPHAFAPATHYLPPPPKAQKPLAGRLAGNALGLGR